MINAKLIYITTADQSEATRIGRVLVEDRLIACANILDGMTSIYRWEGKICETRECVLIAKTTAPLVDQVIARVKELHSYEVPCVVSVDLEKGHPEFLEWIHQSLKS